MNLGPFSPLDIDSVTRILDTKRIKFELIVDEAQLKKLTEKFSDGARFFYTGNKVFWIAIADSDFNLIADELEKYGVAAPSDGSYELGENSEED